MKPAVPSGGPPALLAASAEAARQADVRLHRSASPAPEEAHAQRILARLISVQAHAAAFPPPDSFLEEDRR
jgi:hypothetical protein